MKKIISVILSIVMILSLLPIAVLPTAAENAGQAQPLFRIDVSGNSFTIRRSNNTQQQTVNYRTVSITAVEGIHFTAARGTLTFNVGETSKTVTVLKVVAARGPIGILKLSDATGMEVQKIRYSLRILEQNGLIRPSQQGAVLGDNYTGFMETMEQNFRNLENILRTVEEQGKQIEEQ